MHTLGQEINMTCILLNANKQWWVDESLQEHHLSIYWTQLWSNIFFYSMLSFSTSTIVAASRMLTNCIYSVYIDVLYKVDKSSFTKDYFKKRNIKYLSILKKKMSNDFFSKVYGKVNFFVSSHGKFTCIYNTYEPLTYAHPWHYKQHSFF